MSPRGALQSTDGSINLDENDQNKRHPQIFRCDIISVFQRHTHTHTHTDTHTDIIIIIFRKHTEENQ